MYATANYPRHRDRRMRPRSGILRPERSFEELRGQPHQRVRVVSPGAQRRTTFSAPVPSQYRHSYVDLPTHSLPSPAPSLHRVSSTNFMHPAQQDSSDSDSEDYYYDAVEEADPSMYIPYQTAERPNIDELATAVADRLSYGDRWRRRRLDGVYQLDDNLAPDEWYNENYSDDDYLPTGPPPVHPPLRNHVNLPGTNQIPISRYYATHSNTTIHLPLPVATHTLPFISAALTRTKERNMFRWDMLSHPRSLKHPGCGSGLQCTHLRNRRHQATSPPLSYVRILSPDFPWTIDVGPRDPVVGVTCWDILKKIYYSMQEPIPGNYEGGGVYSALNHAAHGMRKIDWLAGCTMFGGLYADVDFRWALERLGTGAANVLVLRCVRKRHGRHH